jgi:hypothetical protein
MQKITVPRFQDLKSTLRWVSDLHCLPDSEHYSFDFKDMDWIEPFPLVFLSANIRKFKNSKPRSRFTAMNFRDHSYPAHMGFFEAFNLHFGNKPGEAKGSDTYLPMTIVSVESLIREAAKKNYHVGAVLDTDAQRLAQLLTRDQRSHLVDTLAYALREIMRNAVEHSESGEFEYCGQYWPAQDKVEVAILDGGIGVRKSLSCNHKILSDDHAMRLALLPGVSGKAVRNSKIEQYDHWDNSGYGLYLTSRLCAIGGSFFICSGKRGMVYRQDGNHKYLDSSYQGTALRMVLNTANLTDLKSSLRRLRREGEELARRISGAQPRASGASGGIRLRS